MHKDINDNRTPILEEVLRKGEPDTLSLSERTDMKRTLLAHINLHVEKVPTRSPFTGFFPRIILGAAFACLVVVFTGVAAENSGPGDPLYLVKLQVIDPITMAFELPHGDIIAAHTWKLERRLEEARILEEEARLDDAVAAVLIEEVTESARAIEDEVDGVVHANTSAGLVSIDRVSALLDAHDAVLTGHDLANTLGMLSHEVNDARNAAVVDILQNAASTSVSDYIDASLQDIAESLEGGTLSADTINSIEVYIEEISVTLAEADYAETVEHISEANQRILVEAYLTVVADGMESDDTESIDQDNPL